LTRRVYVPSKAQEPLNEAKKLLYLLKTAVTQENQEKILDRIDKIRALLTEVTENIKEDC
jgi:hypothetical protein